MMRSFPYLFAAGVAFAACGSLNPNTASAPTLSTLKGNLTNPDSLPTGSSVRIAVVWRSDTPGQFNVAEDLPVQPVFPSSFEISLNGPPPAGAMNVAQPPQPPPTVTPPGAGPPPSDAGPATGGAPSGGLPVRHLDPTSGAPSLQYAIGTVVAYDDLNGNGKLDLVPVGATAYVDTIVATNAWTAIVYLQGDLSDPSAALLGYVQLQDASGHMPSLGYNLLDLPKCDVRPPASPIPSSASGSACTTPPAADAGTCQQMQWLPMSTPYSLAVASSPEVSTLMCQNTDNTGLSSVGSGPAGPYDPANQPATYPDPCDPNVACSPDGSQYMYSTCTTVSQGICEGTYQSCSVLGYARPTPVPAGWPCIH